MIHHPVQNSLTAWQAGLTTLLAEDNTQKKHRHFRKGSHKERKNKQCNIFPRHQHETPPKSKTEFWSGSILRKKKVFWLFPAFQSKQQDLSCSKFCPVHSNPSKAFPLMPEAWLGDPCSLHKLLTLECPLLPLFTHPWHSPKTSPVTALSRSLPPSFQTICALIP